MTEAYKIRILTESNLQEATEVIVRSFLTLNSLWKKFNPSYQASYAMIRSKLLPCLNGDWSYVLEKNQKIIGVVNTLDLLDYLQHPLYPSNEILFEKLGKAGKQLEKKIDISSFKRGDAFYAPFGVIDPKAGNQGYSLKFWWQLFTYNKIGGRKYFYTRVSNKVSLKMLFALGAEVIAEVEVQGEKDEKLWMTRMDLTKPFPSYKMLEAIAANNKERKKVQKPSL